MGFGLWRTLGRLVSLPNEGDFFIPSNKSGRLIYEEFDPKLGKSSNKSTFYEVKMGKISPRSGDDGEEVACRINVDLNEDSQAEELRG